MLLSTFNSKISTCNRAMSISDSEISMSHFAILRRENLYNFTQQFQKSSRLENVKKKITKIYRKIKKSTEKWSENLHKF